MVFHRNLVGNNLHEPKAHTHVESEITDLDKYTQAEVDALLSNTGLTDLDDFPAAYTGKAGDFLRVNATEDGVEFLSNQYVVNQIASSDNTISATKTTPGSDPANYDIKISTNYKTFAQSQGLFDLRYSTLVHTHVEADITDLDHTDADAIHTNVRSEIYGAATPAEAMHVDSVFLFERADDFYNKGVITFSKFGELVSEHVEAGKVPYLTGAPSLLNNGMIWMESDGLHIYYNSTEKVVAGV
jgi:hypothetical protein